MSKINLPVKCGEMYIKFDDNGNPEYGFITPNNKKIEKFVNLSQNIPTTIVLPILENDFAVYPSKKELEIDMKDKKNWWYYSRYVNGNVYISPDAFTGISKATIVVPKETSVMLDWGAFDDKANIDFILPENMGIKQIFRSFSTVMDYEHENWTLLANKGLNVHIDGNSEAYDSREFIPNMNKYVHFSVNPNYCVVDGEIVERVKTSEDECEM